MRDHTSYPKEITGIIVSVVVVVVVIIIIIIIIIIYRDSKTHS
jgi:heme/copper-type cytochrome/quinol oxidase subunit 2